MRHSWETMTSVSAGMANCCSDDELRAIIVGGGRYTFSTKTVGAKYDLRADL